MRTWEEWTRNTKFREKYRSGSRYINATSEIVESIRRSVEKVLAANAEKDELGASIYLAGLRVS